VALEHQHLHQEQVIQQQHKIQLDYKTEGDLHLDNKYRQTLNQEQVIRQQHKILQVQLNEEWLKQIQDLLPEQVV
jgi:hypothetical protein